MGRFILQRLILRRRGSLLAPNSRLFLQRIHFSVFEEQGFGLYSRGVRRTAFGHEETGNPAAGLQGVFGHLRLRQLASNRLVIFIRLDFHHRI